MIEDKQKTIYYFKARFSKEKVQTLQSLLKPALDSLTTVEERREDIFANASFFQLINDPGIYKGCLIGELASYESGAKETELETSDLKKTSLKKKAIAADSGHEFAEKGLQYLVSKNDVIVLQSNDVKYRSLERHLNWLLEMTGSLQDGDRVELSPAPSKKLRNTFASGDINAIAIKAYASTTTTASTQRLTLGGDVLNYILPKLGIKKLQNSNLKVELLVKQSRKELVATDHDVLAKLAHLAKNLDEEAATIKLNNGAEIRGADMKLSKTITVQYSKDTGLPALADLHSKMHGWLVSLLQSQLVLP